MFSKAALYILKHCIRIIQHFLSLSVLYTCELFFVSCFSKELLVHLLLLVWVLLLYVLPCCNFALPFQLLCQSFWVAVGSCFGVVLGCVCIRSFMSLHASWPAALVSLCCMATLWRLYLSLLNPSSSDCQMSGTPVYPHISSNPWCWLKGKQVKICLITCAAYRRHHTCTRPQISRPCPLENVSAQRLSLSSPSCQSETRKPVSPFVTVSMLYL